MVLLLLSRGVNDLAWFSRFMRCWLLCSLKEMIACWDSIMVEIELGWRSLLHMVLGCNLVWSRFMIHCFSLNFVWKRYLTRKGSQERWCWFEGHWFIILMNLTANLWCCCSLDCLWAVFERDDILLGTVCSISHEWFLLNKLVGGWFDKCS